MLSMRGAGVVVFVRVWHADTGLATRRLRSEAEAKHAGCRIGPMRGGLLAGARIGHEIRKTPLALSLLVLPASEYNLTLSTMYKFHLNRTTVYLKLN